MDLRKIKKLIELVDESGITELEVKSGEEAIRISRAAPLAPAVAAVPAAPAAQAAEPAAPVAPARGETIAAPMAGTFYRAPAPGEAPFAPPGASVRVGDVLCIIESMKMMNHIESELAGEVLEVVATDGQPVETGATLFRIG